MRRLAFLALTVACSACAHGIGADQQKAYFHCPGIIIDTAVENLAGNGYKLAEQEGDTFAETGWTEFKMGTNRGSREYLTLRIKVEATAGGVTFTAWEPTQTGEVPWDFISQRQVADPVYKTLLNKIRRDVCGGTGDFFE